MDTGNPGARPLLRALLTHPEGLPWLFRARPSVPIAALTSATCGLLVSWQFAGPDDARIVPFVQELTWREGAAQPVTPEAVDAMVRGLLGDYGQLDLVPPQQITLVQILISRAIVFGNSVAPPQVDELLNRAELLAGRLNLDPAAIPQSAPVLSAPARAPRRSHGRAPLWSGLAAAAIAAVLVTGLATPGWMRTHESTTTLAGVVRKLVDAENAGDIDAADALSCHPFSPSEIQAQKRQARRGHRGNAVPDGPAEISKDTATQRILRTEESGERETVIIRLKRHAGTWCVAGLGDAAAEPDPSSGPSQPTTPGSSSSEPDPSTSPANPDGAAFASAAARFLSLINGAKLAAAESMVCEHPASAARRNIRVAVIGRTSARLAPGHRPTGSGIARVYTLQADPGGGPGNLAMIAQDQRICVYDFMLATG